MEHKISREKPVPRARGGKRKYNFSRRDFLKVAGVGAATAALTSCVNPEPDLSPEIEQQTESILSPATFLTLTGIALAENTSQNPNARAQSEAQLLKLLKNPEQIDSLLTVKNGNLLSVADFNIVSDMAIAEGRAIDFHLCSDARGLTVAKICPSLVISDDTRWLIDQREAGVQPSKARPGITKSMFYPHEVVCGAGTSCGYLGGVEQAIRLGDEEARIVLANHHVPVETIENIIKWKNTYGSQFNLANLSDEGLAQQWARIGGSINSYINDPLHVPYSPGQGFLTQFGIQGNAEGIMTILGYVDGAGNYYSPEAGAALAPDLAGIPDYLNKPHPIIESYLRQTPHANILSTSQFSPQALFGDGFIFPEKVFVVNSIGGVVTPEILAESLGYSIGALEQKANIIYLVADTPEKMAQSRQALLKSTYIESFLEKEGLIVELLVDEQGIFRDTVVVRNLENPMGLLKYTLTQEEEVLRKNGAPKVFGSLRVIETVKGESILVRIQSKIDGKIYDVNLPKNSAYSSISAELLEQYGLPAVEALWYEKALINSGKFLGRAGIVAGAIWMAYDGINYFTEVMGLGETVPFDWVDGDNADLSQYPDLHKSILELGLENTPANRIYYGNDMSMVDLNFQKRIFNNAVTAQDQEKNSYFIKLDAYMANIPGLLSDTPFDIGSSIKVMPDWEFDTVHLDGDGHPTIFIKSITYTNVTNGESIRIRKADDRVNYLPPEKSTDGINYLPFDPNVKAALAFNSNVVKPGSEEVYSVPLEFSFENGREVIKPKYELKEAAMEGSQGEGFEPLFSSVFTLLGMISRGVLAKARQTS